uniref:Esterase OVCA2 n=1 Tax=Apteryx owenii TaxID=8824 RepID=A0A8B9Q5J2_APTOW
MQLGTHLGAHLGRAQPGELGAEPPAPQAPGGCCTPGWGIAHPRRPLRAPAGSIAVWDAHLGAHLGAQLAGAEPGRVLCTPRRRFRERTGALRKALRGRAELVALSAPHPVSDGDSDDDPRGWWFSGPGTFEAQEEAAAPAGLEESLSAVAAALAERGPFDGLLGFSQGAALAAMVCALRARGDPRFPVAFAILVAGFASRAPAHGHFYRQPIALPTLHVVGDTDAVIAPHLSQELAQRFVEPVVVAHPGGHFVPAAAPQKKAYLDFLDRFRAEERASSSHSAPLQ